MTNDLLNVNTGSLYPALYWLEQRGPLKVELGESESGRWTKVYSLTTAGRKQLSERRAAWERFSGALAPIFEVGRLPTEETP